LATNNNFLVKVTDASMKDIRTALKDAGIEVRDIISMHKEEIDAVEEEVADDAAEGEANAGTRGPEDTA